MAYSFLIQNLIEKLKLLPTVGPKTAEQYAFAIKELGEKNREELAGAIKELRNLGICHLCNKICSQKKETNGEIFCEICADEKRDRSLLMIVGSEPDLESIEKTVRYQGLYFILGEANEQNIKKLVHRLQSSNLQPTELVFAFDITPQNEVSMFEIKQAVKKAALGGIAITRLGRGLPTGADLRYADTQTILGALDHREHL